MKPTTVPVVCSIVLALMAGAAATHHAAVRDLVQLATIHPALFGPMPSHLLPPTLPVPKTDAETLEAIREVQARNTALQETLAAQKTTAEPAATPQTTVDPDLKKLLAELVAQNRFLQNQVAETNRDIMELQFRVDTHSEQFRPLKIQEEITYEDPSIGVLPPLDVP